MKRTFKKKKKKFVSVTNKQLTHSPPNGDLEGGLNEKESISDEYCFIRKEVQVYVLVYVYNVPVSKKKHTHTPLDERHTQRESLCVVVFMCVSLV